MDFQQMIPETVATTASGRRKRSRPLSADKRERVIADWRASGKSQRAYCLEHHLTPSRFNSWIKKEELQTQPVSTPTIVATPAPTDESSKPPQPRLSPAQSLSIELKLANNTSLTIHGDCQPSFILTIIEAVCR